MLAHLFLAFVIIFFVCMPEEHTLHNTRKTCCSGTPTSFH